MQVMAIELTTGILATFCGCSNESGKGPCFRGHKQMGLNQFFNFLLDPCFQQAVACFINLCFWLTLIAMMVICNHQVLVQKKGDILNSFQIKKKLSLFAAALSLLLGLVNVGVGVWLLGLNKAHQGFRHVHDWIFTIVQGIAWITIAITLKPNLGRPIISIVKLWWIVEFLLGTTMAALSAFDIVQGKPISMYKGLALASWPVCFILFFCALQNSSQSFSASSNLRESLLHGSPASTEDSSTVLQKAGSFLSRVTFSWLGPLLHLGYSRPLEMKDIPPVSLQDQAKTNHRLFSVVWESLKKNPSNQHLVFNSLAKCYWKDIVATGFLAFFRTICTSAGPLLIHNFVEIAAGKRSFKNEGYVLVVILFLVKVIESFSQRHWYFGSRRLGMKVRSTLITAVYHKELCLSSLAKHRHSIGEIVTYIGVDAYRIGEFPWWLHWIWTIPCQIIIALIIFSTTVGLATLPGLLLIILIILLNSPLATSLQRCQAEFMVAQDGRLRRTTEVLSGMKVIKLQAWEDKFKVLLDQLREREFQWLAKAQKKKSYFGIIYWISPTLVGSVIFVTCLFLKIQLTPTNIFTVLATFRIIQEPVRMVPDLLATIIQVRVSLSRLNEFLHGDELRRDAVQRSHFWKPDYAIRIEDGLLSWNPKEKPTLTGINMKVQHGEKIAVCGAIGSGKSALLHCILGEIPKISGTVRLSGSIAYVPQTAWIQTGTIKENIIFGMEIDEARYKKTLQICALEQDIANLPFGDLTEIGERGINMSGGQKQRIQLARAVYNDADIYLLDDPFSAVDAHTASRLFNDCILEALKSKTVILVTHQVEFLPTLDLIVVMKEGEIQQAGTYEKLLREGQTFEQLVAAHQEALVTVKHENNTTELSETEISQVSRTSSGLELCEKQNRAETFANASQLIQEEEKETGDMGFKSYYDYISIARGGTVLLGMILGQAAFVASNMSSNIWLAKEVSNPNISGPLLVGMYAALSAISGICVFVRARLSVVLGLRASKAFFEGLMSSVTKAPMTFFDSTPTGRILNRASTDMNVLDTDIPFCLGFVLAGLLELAGIITVLALVTWQILIIVVPIIFLVHKLQRFYLASSRELMRINARTKAPIVNSSSETFSGAVTIRAFQMAERFKQRNMQLVDCDASLFLHTQAASEWLTLRLEATGNIVLCVAALFLVLSPSDNITAGFTGLAISYALALNTSQVSLIWWQCNFVNYNVSVERIKQYMCLPKEAADIIESNRPPPQWPTRGKVILENLQIRYQMNSPLVLQGITCTFEAGQKIGVVGRTGSGKTTLINALFRLVEPAGGKMCIDEIDICTIGLHDLRARLGIIPQEPVLFRGTVRTNLDPLSQYSDSDIWESLKKCQLERLIHWMPGQLDSPVSDDGENWSAGQRQLFCLGRVLLKHSRVLVLDEATASMDSTTDAVLQDVIKNEFCDSTVITVAHRIPTVLNSDMILALRDGRLVEFDTPKNLTQNRTSLFANLVAEYWARSSQSF